MYTIRWCKKCLRTIVIIGSARILTMIVTRADLVIMHNPSLNRAERNVSVNSYANTYCVTSLALIHNVADL